MPVIRAAQSFTHDLPHASFCSLATPSRGAVETSVWRVQLHASEQPSTPHSLTREEIFVVLSGSVCFQLDGVSSDVQAGDTVVVPRETQLSVQCLSEHAELLCCLPVGGQARFGAGEPFTPPWAL